MKNHVKLKCWSCGAEIGKQLIGEFEESIRKDLVEELGKKQSELNKQRDEFKKLSQQLAKEKDKLLLQSSLKVKEREKIINDLKKKLDEARRRADSAFSSQQLSGEVQELELEQMLAQMYPSDEIVEVKKGELGADCIQIIKGAGGTQIGKIMYESKNTKVFSANWISKLKTDNLAAKADVVVIVTNAMPKGVTGRFSIIDNVWICGLADVKELSLVLRFGLAKLQALASTQKNKQTSMEMLYKFLTSEDFKNTFESILNGFKSLQDSHLSEKLKMQRVWKEREKILEQVLSQSISFYGSLKGIAGVAIPEIKTLQNLPAAS